MSRKIVIEKVPPRPEAKLLVLEGQKVVVDQFSINPIDRFAKLPVPAFQRPLEVACFSFDAQRKLHLDRRGLRYYAPPNQAIPLSNSFESYITRDLSQPEHLDALIVALYQQRLVSEGGPPSAASRRKIPTFVTWRGILTKLFGACFDRREGLELRACLFNGTIYIEEHELESKREREKNMSPDQALWAYGGYRFEGLCTLPVPETEATEEMLKERETAVVNNNEQFCSVLKTRIGEDLIYIGAEVDCALGPTREGSTEAYVELKTNKVITDERGDRAFGSKLMKIYLQSFLAGIPRVIVGYRDETHLIQDIREFETFDIPVMTKGDVDWDANVCLAFGAEVLKFLKRTITKDDAAVYTVKLEANASRISVSEGGGAKPFLPEWFINGDSPPL